MCDLGGTFPGGHLKYIYARRPVSGEAVEEPGCALVRQGANTFQIPVCAHSPKNKQALRPDCFVSWLLLLWPYP